MEWISVKDRLPESYKNVLAFSKRKETFVAKHREHYGWESLSYQEFIVTHWMNLPNPPIESESV